MNSRNLHIPQENAPHPMPDDEFANIDFEKLRQIFTSSWLWVVAIFIFCLSTAFMYIRYTKPIYSAQSILKLDIKNEVNLLGLQNPLEQGIKGISGEIEILRSRLFFSKVAESVNMDVSYFHPGRSHLVDERFGNSPFIVEFELKNYLPYDKRYDVEILNDEKFALSMNDEKVIFSEHHRFDDPLENENFIFTLRKTEYFEDQKKLNNFYFTINSQSALITYFESNVSVEPVNLNANTIKISLRDFNQHKAISLLTAIDTIYLAFTKRDKNRAIEQKIDFLQSQVEKTSKELTEYEEYFEKFTIQNRTTDLSKDVNRTIILLNQLDSQRYNLRDRLAKVDLVVQQFDADKTVNIITLPTVLSDLVTSYNELVNEKEFKLSSYNENTQIIKNIDKKTDVAKKASSKGLLAYKNGLVEKLKKLNSKRSILESNFKELPSMGTSYNKSRRLYALQEDFYFSLIQSKIELEIARAGTVTNFVVLDPPYISNEPFSPQKPIVYGLGLTASIIFSFLFLAISYLLHNKITSQKELEKLIHTPILGIIPKYKRGKMATSRLILTDNPKSSINESLRSIRTNMEFIASGKENKIVSVTSTVSGEGKTFTTVNLGTVFAYADQKVVVVDLDMRKPKVHLAFNTDISPEKGMSTILMGRDSIGDCLQNSDLENLSFISAGPTPPNPSELLLGSALDDFLEELKKSFDVIFIDSPPVGIVTDGVLIMKKSDLSIYVVRADYSKKSYLKSIHRIVSTHKFDHLSVILNGVKSGTGDDYGYGYYNE